MVFFIKHIWLINFIPLIIGIIYFSKFDRSLRAFFLFIIFGTLTEITTKTGIYFFNIKNTMPIGHIYVAGTCFFTIRFYLFQLQNFINKKLIIFILIISEIFIFLNFFFIQSIYSFPSISGASVAILLVIFSILLFSKIMSEAKIKKLSTSPVVWINCAILIYYSSNFFYYILYNIILNSSREFSIRTIGIFSIINGLFYILIAIGFSKTKKVNVKRQNF